MQKVFEEKLATVNTLLSRLLSQSEGEEHSRVLEAMEYSASAGGKRIRPLLVLEFCSLCGGRWEDALPFAAAIEMVHTYSLIHDDLPCMDDDDLRRGRPSCHVQFGEATALLAGDGLLTDAFETLTGAELPAERIVRAVQILSGHSGVRGMIGGQELDLENEGKPELPLSVLTKTDEKKTADLLIAACQLGVAAAGGTKEDFAAAEKYGYALGIAFQIVDDILDVTSTPEAFGKPIGSDAENGKPTYASMLGLSGAKEEAEKYTARALEALAHFPGNEALILLTQSLLGRNN